MIFLPTFLALMHLLITETNLIIGKTMPDILNELNERLIISTNIIFCKQFDNFIPFEAQTSRFVYSSLEAFNITSLWNHVGSDNKLFVSVGIVGNEPPYELFAKLDSSFQLVDFLLVIGNKIEEDIWKRFIKYAWRLGYVKILIYSTYTKLCYHQILFPSLRIKETNIADYTNFRGTFRNVNGYQVRVAAYNNVPRSFIYADKNGKRIYAGYYMRFARAFIHNINATFKPVYTPNDSPENCTQFILNNTVDICADALVKNSKAFSVSRELRISPANVIVPHGKPLLSYRYWAAPFNTKVWIALGSYVFLISGFLCLIHWLRSGKWDYSQNLLEVYSSLLFTGFRLKAINGSERYILFGVLFISGFVYSTMYLALLKSMLISETFEKQIQTFEELAESNIPLLIDPYDRMIFQHHHIPKSLWTAVRTVSSETLLNHRNNFDQYYAYVMFPDRMDMFVYAQQYLRHPKFRRIPIDICFLFAGFPMSKKWFLKHQLSRAWFHSFESGILDKMAWDAYRESVGQGYLRFPITEHLEAKPLGLYYFMMPTISLALGYSVALLSFIMEVIACKLNYTLKYRCG